MVKLQKALLAKCKSEDEQVGLRQSFVSAHEFRYALTQVLKDKQENARKSSLGSDRYECANWAYKQADNVGYQRAIEEILKYL